MSLEPKYLPTMAAAVLTSLGAPAALAHHSYSMFDTQYFPLKDGRPGGSFVKAIHEDGTESIGDQFAPGVAAAAKQKRDAQ